MVAHMKIANWSAPLITRGLSFGKDEVHTNKSKIGIREVILLCLRHVLIQEKQPDSMDVIEMVKEVRPMLSLQCLVVHSQQ